MLMVPRICFNQVCKTRRHGKDCQEGRDFCYIHSPLETVGTASGAGPHREALRKMSGLAGLEGEEPQGGGKEWVRPGKQFQDGLV